MTNTTFTFRQPPPVTREEIADGLTRLGVTLGDRLVVHTAMSAFGQIDGGANTVLKALLDAVGPGGTLMFPTMTWRSAYMREPVLPAPSWVIPYNRHNSPCDKDMGRVPETARKHPRARRSGHPLMSVTAIGAHALPIVADHPMDDPLKPYRTLASLGGKVLMLGVDHTRNTTIHAAEFLMRLPHLSGPAHALVADEAAPNGVRIKTMAQEPDCSLGFELLNDLVTRRERQIGGAIAWLCSGQEIIDTALRLLEADPGALLCDHPGCRTCTRGRALYYPSPAENPTP